ncbi:uncharacterized protein LOC109546096 [Dendroctonus ponderosae]|uniref:MADF domain-containing protein n=1 Tax=Dendroctonus ponderosae TaxID=77166 RepID=A0AAR5QGZ4_DENPD|nr:uncharacterized protein LOC109546096 [Dendroctonus ponderosae]KAH1023868.1 hypothetical protein HUJ05_003459 [Dendroctonus ponderosae]
MATIFKQLIESVKEYPILYDCSHGDFKNFKQRDKVWDEIGLKLEQDGHVLKGKWRNLRDSYAKFLKAKHPYKKWHWAEHMQHFRPFLMNSKDKTNNFEDIDCEESNEDTSEENIKIEVTQMLSPYEDREELVERTPSPPNIENESSNSATKKRAFKRANENSLDTAIEYLEKRPIINGNSIDLIFRGYAEAIKHFSPKRQAYTKLKVAEIITQQEMEQQEEDLITFQNSVCDK